MIDCWDQEREQRVLLSMLNDRPRRANRVRGIGVYREPAYRNVVTIHVETMFSDNTLIYRLDRTNTEDYAAIIARDLDKKFAESLALEPLTGHPPPEPREFRDLTTPTRKH